jgi:hypothetical protein
MKSCSLAWIVSALGVGMLASAAQAQLPPKPQAAPPGQAATLTPEDLQQAQQAAAEGVDKLRALMQIPPDRRAHSLLDEVFTGAMLAKDDQQGFVDFFAPDRAMLHQELDDGLKVLQRVMEGGVPGGPVPAKLAQIVGPAPSFAAEPVRASSAGLLGYPRPVGRRGTYGGLFLRTQASSGTATQGGLTVNWTDSDDIVKTSASGDDGSGTGIKWSGETWKDSSRWVADNETDFGFIVDKAKQEVGASGKLDLSAQDHARVQRCPSADGIVKGQGKIAAKVLAAGNGSTGSAEGGFEFKQEFSAEGHVQENATIKDVKVDVDYFFAESHLSSRAGERANYDSMNIRFTGTLTFDPHTSGDTPNMQITSANTVKGFASAEALAKTPGWRSDEEVFIDALRKAYLKAEKEWNFEDREHNSKCVTTTFMPKTKTKRAKPNESVPVTAELVAVNGQQPTSGTFDELEPVKGGSIAQNGAHTASRAPAQLTYTAPSQAWSPSDPPGFDVVKAKSRAGAFMRAHASEDEYQWLLKAGLNLVIHDRWESHTVVSSLLSEATFPIQLVANANGTLSGKAVVQRTHHQEQLAGSICEDEGHWTETWRAEAAYDDTGETLTVKLKFEAGEKEGRVLCTLPPASHSYTEPGYSSGQVPTPLDSFTMPAEEGATKQFVFANTVTKTTIDVTLAPAEEAGR